MYDENKDPFNDKCDKKRHSPERLASHRSTEIQAQKHKSENDVRRHYHEVAEESLHTSERARNSDKGYRADEINDSHAKDVRGSLRHQEAGKLTKLSQRVERNDQSRSLDSGSKESDEPREGVNETRKRRRSKRKDVTSDDDYSHDSHTEDRKEAKRRRKEKRSKKEEKRRRREERSCRKEEWRTEKLKLKAGSNASPLSDSQKEHDGHASYVEPIMKKGACTIDNEEALSDQKKLEIELREMPLESLRAKKGIGH